MKTIKSLLAISVLAVAGAANAAIINTYDVTIDGVFSGAAFGSITAQYAAGTTTKPAVVAYAGSTGGVATLSNSGALTIDYNSYNHLPSGSGDFILGVHVLFQGAIVGDQYTVTSGTFTNLTCLGVTTDCPDALVKIGIAQPLTATPVAENGGGLLESPFNIAIGGANTSTTLMLGGFLTNHLNFNFTPTVPVPAAAWLFGSGLMGLAGLARRRKAI